MASEWQWVTVDQIKANDSRAIAIGPFGSRMKAGNYVSSGIPVIRGNNISDTKSFSKEFVYVAEAFADGLGACNVYGGDLVFPHRGAIGEVGIVPSGDSSRFVLSTSLMKLTCNARIADPYFIFYFFRSHQGRGALLEHASTVGTPGIGQPLSSLKSIKVPLPRLSEQRAIAHILGTLDDKIELNRKQNETLEAMARALFKAWFVDFEPVRAKLEGRWQRGQSLPGLPAHLYDLFPDRLVESELGEIPVDWELRPVRDFAVLKGGKQLEKAHIAEAGPVPVFGGAGVMGYTINHNADGFVISVGRVGAYCGQFFSHRGKAWINNNASLIRPDSKVSGEWLLLALRSIDMDVIKKGAAQPFVSNGDIANVGLVWPGDSIIRAFSSAMVPLMTKAEANERETRSLAQLRNTLLPKLISGDLRIPDAETFLTERGL